MDDAGNTMLRNLSKWGIIGLALSGLTIIHSFPAEAASEAAPKNNNGYVDKLLAEILHRTDAPDAAKLKISKRPALSRDRRLLELISGEIIEYDAIGTKPSWEENLLTIRIPLRKGLQGYRLFFINESSQAELDKAETLEDFKKFSTGSGAQWSTTPQLQAAGFNVVEGDNKAGLMKMLAADRFKTFGRGIDEIYHEYHNAKADYPDLAIENSIALYIPHPTYIFVTPKRPDLAARFETGLKAMIADGSFDTLFWEFFEDDIQRANLHQRKIFRIANPELSAATPFENDSMWFAPEDTPENSTPAAAEPQSN
jgi:hypothetical protein